MPELGVKRNIRLGGEMKYPNFTGVMVDAKAALKRAPIVHPEMWQGKNVRSKPEMATHELLNHSFTVNSTNFPRESLIDQLKPDLPWADDHFAERVGGIPLNPPPSEAWWPHSPQGNKAFMEEGKIFSHTYPERYWPKRADHLGIGPTEPNTVWVDQEGIRFPYGDLNDLIRMLVAVPHTRQAYLPVWFPEDLGAPLDARRPCSLGYHFIVREKQLHIVYFIRSCDFVRHFHNDIYMTVLLQDWVLNQCQQKSDQDVWDSITLGSFTMHITSLHLFRNDYRRVYG